VEGVRFVRLEWFGWLLGLLVGVVRLGVMGGVGVCCFGCGEGVLGCLRVCRC